MNDLNNKKDNIVQFPGPKRNSPPQNMDELIESIDSIRMEKIDFILDEVMSIVFSVSLDSGFDLTSDNAMKSTVLFVEAFKSALCSSVNMYHPLQQLSVEMISDIDEDDGGEDMDEDTGEDIYIYVDAGEETVEEI